MAKLMPNGKQQFFDANGDPLASGKVYTYAAGTSTPKDTYTTYTGGTANANPVILDARGEATIFWDGAYKVVLKDSTDATIWTVDNITTLSSAADISYDSSTIDVILKDHSCYVVDTIASLRAVDKTKYTHCFVKGYYAAGDGGGGMYYYDSADTTSADDGGARIVGTDSGRWKLIYNGVIDVRQYGAKPDGATTATSAFQNAIDFLVANGGELLVIGEFYLATSVTISAGTTNEIIIRGQNPTYDPANYTLKSIIGLADAAYFGTSTSFGTVKNIQFVNYRFLSTGTYARPIAGASQAAAIAAMAGRASSTSTIDWENCGFIGFQYGLYEPAASAKNCFFDCTNGIYNGGNSGYLTKIEGCTFAISGVGSGIRSGVAISVASGYCEIESCFIESYAGGCITLDIDTYMSVVSNCILKNESSPTSYSIYATSTATTGRLKINNCYISNTSITKSAVYLNTGFSYNIENCVISSATPSYCVELAASAGYGQIRACDNIGTGTLLGGNAASILKCIQGAPLEAHTPTAWTPVLKHAGTERVTAYTTQVGQYTVHDNLVTAICNITVNTISGGASGDAATITGLPFASAAGIKGGGYATYTAGLVTVVDGITADIAAGSQIAALYQGSATGSAVLTYADTVAGCTLNYVFQYFIDR